MSQKLSLGFKAAQELGFNRIFHYLIYKTGVYSGYFNTVSKLNARFQDLGYEHHTPNYYWILPDLNSFPHEYENAGNAVLQEAEEILNGTIRIFGTEKTPLDFAKRTWKKHWTDYERKPDATKDIKFIWEPARFNFGIKLGQAFKLSKDNRFASKFVEEFKQFQVVNPYEIGPNWQSGQEIALRLIAWVVTAHLLQDSEDFQENCLNDLCQAIVEHARRIPITISYAKAQNNNHLLSEAVGLYSAGMFLNQHQSAYRWRKLGKKWFLQGIRDQIESDTGEFSQHSTNYHRMMLMLGLWMDLALKSNNDRLPADVLEKISKSVSWLINHTDRTTGSTINLGHNDGADILKFDNSEFADYRPILQAASRAFLKQDVFSHGEWDLLSIWLNLHPQELASTDIKNLISFPRIQSGNSWGSMRVCKYNTRPAHADQLMVNIWYAGYPLTLDAGTYLYNSPAPWENNLAGTQIHNTVTIDSQDQMTRAGKFLWLDWAQADILQLDNSSISAQHDGYKKVGITHQRMLAIKSEVEWRIEDRILSNGFDKAQHDIQLHWLLPDYPYDLSGEKITLNAPFGKYELKISRTGKEPKEELIIIQAGKTIKGTLQNPVLGWFSQTYSKKAPALSIIFRIEEAIPVEISSVFRIFPE